MGTDAKSDKRVAVFSGDIQLKRTQEHLKQMGFRLNKDVTEEERKKRKEEWKSLTISRKHPHDFVAGLEGELGIKGQQKKQ